MKCVFLFLFVFLLNLINGIRYFLIQTASERVSTSTPSFKRPLTQCGSKKRWDEGITYPDLFNPISVPSIALILTVVSNFQKLFLKYTNNPLTQLEQIEANLNKWITGTKTEVFFWANNYRAVYNSHMFSLTSFGKYSRSKDMDLLGLLQHKLYNYGW